MSVKPHRTVLIRFRSDFQRFFSHRCYQNQYFYYVCLSFVLLSGNFYQDCCHHLFRHDFYCFADSFLTNHHNSSRIHYFLFINLLTINHDHMRTFLNCIFKKSLINLIIKFYTLVHKFYIIYLN